MKKRYMNAITWYFGYNKKEAKNFMNTASKSVLDYLVECYEGTAKKAFYND